jgi:hypothetical protein
MILLCSRALTGSNTAGDIFNQAIPQTVRSSYCDGSAAVDDSQETLDEQPIGRRSSNPPRPTLAALSSGPYSSDNNLENLAETAASTSTTSTATGDDFMNFLLDDKNF